MKLIASSFLYTYLFLCNALIAEDQVIEKAFMEYLGNQNFFSAFFSQKTYSGDNERVVKGSIKANREGMFKLIYEEPVNETLLSDAINFYRYDPELEQLEIRPIENLIDETPIGLFSAKTSVLLETYNLRGCKKLKNNLRCELVSKLKDNYLQLIEVNIFNNVINFIRYKDSFDQEVLLGFTDVSLKEIDLKEFYINIPDGIDIIKH